jgi:serine/threonine-protein kinase
MAHSTLVDLVGRVLAGRYRLLAPIGTGSSGRVYLADDVRLRRRVAVKVLHTGLADDMGFLRRFRAEAQMAAGLHHPHVVAVYDWGEDDGVPFMVLELLKGGSLRGVLDTGARLSPAQAAHVGRQVAAALRYAHARGLVHRDIKPANLLFDEHGIVRVADFGLARALAEASWTEPSGTVVGTARYAAPEQVGGAALDARADLYSLAVVLVESCTGEVPIVGDTAISTMTARTTRGIEPPPSLGPLVPVLARAGRPDPAERFANAAAMGSALSAAARRLRPPEPLTLAGLGDLDDLDPTRVGRATRSHDGVALPTDVTMGEAEIPLAVAAESRHTVMRRSAIPVVVAIVIALTLIGALALLLAAGSGTSVSVPSLVGLSQKDAANRATQAGLLMKVVERRTLADPSELVVEQHPSPGAFLSQDDSITVVVSRGPPPVLLPDVTGKATADAQAALQAAGFVVTVTPKYDDTVPKGIALSTDPPLGTKQPPDTPVTLFVSNGPAPVPVPSVAGKTYDQAAAAISAAHLAPVRRDVFSDTVSSGTVIGTDPAAGALAPRNSQVGVNVSKGPEFVQVPNVVGMTVEAASAKLAQYGLTPDVQNYGPGKSVKAQAPQAGTTVKKRSTVTLYL